MTKLLRIWVNGTRKVHPDDDDKAIPWIAASRSSDQKATFIDICVHIKGCVI